MRRSAPCTSASPAISPPGCSSRSGDGSAFCKRYGLTRLVYCERHDHIEGAIAREKAMKAWKRRWKTQLIEGMNPSWADLYERINA